MNEMPKVGEIWIGTQGQDIMLLICPNNKVIVVPLNEEQERKQKFQTYVHSSIPNFYRRLV